MSFENSEIKFYLSGGANNNRKSRSLGGDISNTEISDNINNLFSQTTINDSKDGSEIYRCFYIVNESTSVLNNLIISAPTISTISMGFDLSQEKQQITIGGNPVGGTFTIDFRAIISGTLAIQTTSPIEFTPDPSVQATRIQVALDEINLTDEVVVEGRRENTFWIYTITFSLYKRYNLFEVNTDGMIGDSITFTVESIVNGSPVNTTATDIGIENIAPNGVEYTDEITISNFNTLDTIAIWLKRIVPIREVAVGDIDEIDLSLTFIILNYSLKFGVKMQSFLEYRQYIKKQEYEVYKYFFPVWMEKRLDFLSHAFLLMDDTTPIQFKRRKDASENIESAIMILARLEQMLHLEIPMVAGSCYLNPIPWAVLGSDVEACHTVLNFNDLVQLYLPRIKETNSFRGYYVNFRVSPNLPWEIGARNDISPHAIVSIAVCLACDIIRFCGPDCDVLFDFFSNDSRENSPNIKKWEIFRIKMFGEVGKIKEKPYDFKVGQLSDPPIPLISNTFFEEVDDDIPNEIAKNFEEKDTLLSMADLDKFFLFDDE